MIFFKNLTENNPFSSPEKISSICEEIERKLYKYVSNWNDYDGFDSLKQLYDFYITNEIRKVSDAVYGKIFNLIKVFINISSEKMFDFLFYFFIFFLFFFLPIFF